MRVATYNVQNLRLRMRSDRPALDAAADRDVPYSSVPVDRASADRRETARVIALANPDVLALQEVFDQPTLEHFHSEFLLPAGLDPFPVRYCNRGNDGAGSMAILSRLQPDAIISNATATAEELGLPDLPGKLKGRPLFRRDCLEIVFGACTVFACHFKAPFPDASLARTVRRAEAFAVRRIVERRFPDPAAAHWIVLGDLNEPGSAPTGGTTSLSELASGFSVDLIERLPPTERWTYEVPGSALTTCPDRILLSPRLAQANADVVPKIIRMGMPRNRASTGRDRPSDHRSPEAPNASDHALLYADLVECDSGQG